MQITENRYLLAADIDGTLTPRGNSLTPAVRSAVRRAAESGVEVVLVTSRPLKAALPIHRELQLTTPLVCLNGATIHEPASLELMAQHTLPDELLRELHALTVSRDPGADFYLRSGDRYAATSLDNEVVRSFIERSGVAPEARGDFDEIAALTAAVHRMGIIPSRRELLPELRRLLAATFPERVNVAVHDGLFLSVSPAPATKLDAVRYLCRRYGYEQPRVFAIGDSEDDQALVRWSAFGVAMGNASPDVQRAADHVCPRVEEDGFASAVERMIERATRPEPGQGERIKVPRDGFALRYGENPFIRQARVRSVSPGGAAPTSLLHGYVLFDGKALSHNNVVDIDATVRMLWEFSPPTVVCSKHTHPAVIASGGTVEEALHKVLRSGDSSVYGSVLALNRPVDASIVRALGDVFISVLVAPSCSPEVVGHLAAQRERTQVFLLPSLDVAGRVGDVPRWERRAIWGGELEQEHRTLDELDIGFTQLGNQAPLTGAEWSDLRFGMRAVRYAKTNAAVIVSDLQTHAIANAQTTRYWAIELAVQRSGKRAEGAILVCDGRFSHRDAFDLAARSGVGVIAAPRGLVPEKTLDAWAREQRVRLVCFPVRLFHS